MFVAACHYLGIRHPRTRSYTPRTNGKAERFIQTAQREWGARLYQSRERQPSSNPGFTTTTGFHTTPPRYVVENKLSSCWESGIAGRRAPSDTRRFNDCADLPSSTSLLITQGPSAKGVIGGDVTAIDGKPEGPRTYVEQYGSIGQVHPGLRLLVSRTARNAMMAAQCGDSLSRPAIPAPRKMAVAVQNASDEVIAANTGQNPDGFNQLPRGLCAALATTSARQAKLCMGTTFPVQGERELARCAIHVHKNFLDQRANNALLQPHTCGGISPDCFQLLGELVEVLQGSGWICISGSAVLLDTHFDLARML